jgi:hypothetical protein
MKTGERVLVFAHPRSGSTNICRILQLHPDVNVCEEPFNSGYTGWARGNKNYVELVHDVASLDEQLEDIFTTYNGLKLLDDQLPDDLVTHLLLRPDFRVVFLRRQNLLQATVSLMIAGQTHVWHRWDRTEPLNGFYASLAPLDVDYVRRCMAEDLEHMALCESVVDRRPDDRVLKLVYEDVYFVTRDEQTALLDSLWTFLEVPAIVSERLDYYLRPEMTKLNSEATYRLLPNADEVNEACGSDLTGWLFAADEQRAL